MISSSALLNIARLFIEGSFSVLFCFLYCIVFCFCFVFSHLNQPSHNNDSVKCSQMFPHCIRTVNVLAFKLRIAAKAVYLISCFATFSNCTKQSALNYHILREFSGY